MPATAAGAPPVAGFVFAVADVAEPGFDAVFGAAFTAVPPVAAAVAALAASRLAAAALAALTALAGPRDRPWPRKENVTTAP